MPTTIASTTDGKALRTSSTSSGWTFSPPVLTTDVPRPSRVIEPSGSMRPRSPGTTYRSPLIVRNVSAVFSGCL